MCEITNGKIYVADRDLVCYKVMLENEDLLKSVYLEYEYEIGREYCVKDFECRCIRDDALYEVWYKPLTSFGGWGKIYTIYPNAHNERINLNNKYVGVLYLDAINTDLRCTHRGFYSYTYYGNDSMESGIVNAINIYGSNRIKCVRCRIPEGSKYMVSDNGEVFISERIVIDDTLSL